MDILNLLSILCIKHIVKINRLDLMNLIKNSNDINDILCDFSIDHNSITYGKDKAYKIVETCNKMGIDIVSFFDEDYPSEFLKLNDVPLIIYKKGKISSKKKITVAGTRKPTTMGAEVAREISEFLVKNDYSIVSGLAYGVDTIAHKVSVDNKIATTAILPCNLINIYPKENQFLSERIVNNGGCLLSEYSPLDEIKKYYFIKRDRLQASLSEYVIVVETTKNGGTMHTASYAKKYGKKLICVKFPSGKEKADVVSGNNILLKDEYTIPMENLYDLRLILKV